MVRLVLTSAPWTAAALLLVGAAVATPPREGVVVAGRSLGGVSLGATQAEVVRQWGPRFGRCRGCARPTWYFNYDPFRAQGVAAEFQAGRAVALFTLGSPEAWRTERGLRLGDAPARATVLYGALISLECGTYRALTLRSARAVTAFYVVDERIWGFGLARPSVPVCR